MFGFSFGELLVICMVALIAVGPKKLPGMLHTLGLWLRKMRKMTVDVRNQTGIDELLRMEGLHGGLNELRGLLRGVQHNVSFDAPVAAQAEASASASAPTPTLVENPYANVDVSREYPQEGADAYGALPDDLLPGDPPPPPPAATAPVTDEPAESA